MLYMQKYLQTTTVGGQGQPHHAQISVGEGRAMVQRESSPMEIEQALQG